MDFGALPRDSERGEVVTGILLSGREERRKKALQCGCRLSWNVCASQIEFHAGVTRAEAQSLVKTARVDTTIVGRELDNPATPIPRTPDRPFHQAGSDPLTSQVVANPDPFHLSSPRALTRALKGQARNEGELHRSNHLPAEGRHDDFVIRMNRNCVEGFNLRRRKSGLRGRGREGIAPEQLNDRVQVVPVRRADFNGRRTGQIYSRGAIPKARIFR
jgi:hypothetical protein